MSYEQASMQVHNEIDVDIWVFCRLCTIPMQVGAVGVGAPSTPNELTAFTDVLEL